MRPAAEKSTTLTLGIQALAGIGLSIAVSAPSVWAQSADEVYDPLAKAIESMDEPVTNPEAVVPSQCYTKTDGISNPCWTCHTEINGKNFMGDQDLQAEYSFSDFALENHWKNLFADRSGIIAQITDDDALAYIREDNYTPLKVALTARGDYPGWVPDLDYEQGFDEEGFARDGSWWRAFQYKPFLGTFWPTNGSTDDVIIRLPNKFYQDQEGDNSREIYKINLAILETNLGEEGDTPLSRKVEPINEQLANFDFDEDGELSEAVEVINALPGYYAGAANDEPVVRLLYPLGTEFLHTVRYVDPDIPTLLSMRMKEVRYMRKVLFLDTWAILRAYEIEHDDKDEGKLPTFSGSPLVGLRNDFGWQIQGFIENAQGRLRLQTQEEHLFCMGCHSTVGSTGDQTFAFPRKEPGAAGWGHQDLSGIQDVPQVGQNEPEYLTYFDRVQGGDEFRANTEILERFFPDGVLDEATVRRAAPGGDQDISFLIVPSRERALLLNKAYMALVREQTFEQGRDTVIEPTVNVHEQITNGSTDLGFSGLLFNDGRIRLEWKQ